jgi:hypothetical protein
VSTKWWAERFAGKAVKRKGRKGKAAKDAKKNQEQKKRLFPSFSFFGFLCVLCGSFLSPLRLKAFFGRENFAAFPTHPPAQMRQ